MPMAAISIRGYHDSFSKVAPLGPAEHLVRIYMAPS